MEKNEFRAMIKHLHMKSLTPKEIKAKLDNAPFIAPAFATVYNWMNKFKRDVTSCDASRPGRPIGAAMLEIIDKIHDCFDNIVLIDK